MDGGRESGHHSTDEGRIHACATTHVTTTTTTIAAF